MDSVTQAVLGVADACLGARLGRKAALWGLALGTPPDLDIVVAPLLSATEYLRWHRGPSHGLLLMVLGRSVATVQWFSRGYWIARRDEDGLRLADLRFGELSLDQPTIEGEGQPRLFCWRIVDDGACFAQLPSSAPPGATPFASLWRRIHGQRFGWEHAAAVGGR